MLGAALDATKTSAAWTSNREPAAASRPRQGTSSARAATPPRRLSLPDARRARLGSPSRRLAAKAPAASATSASTRRRCRRGLEARDKRVQQKEQLQLRFGHAAEGRHQNREVPLLLSLDGRRRVTVRAFEVHAIGRAGDFDQPFGAAADRADVLAHGGTGAAGLSDSAERTGHRTKLTACRTGVTAVLD